MELTTENTAYTVDGKEQYRAIEQPQITLSGRGMTKIEFDDLVLSLALAGMRKGLTKVFSGMRPDGDFECIFSVVK